MTGTLSGEMREILQGIETDEHAVADTPGRQNIGLT